MTVMEDFLREYINTVLALTDNILLVNACNKDKKCSCLIAGLLLAPVSSCAEERPSFLVIIDARTFQEVGRAELPSDICMPFSFHGLFLPVK
jgi:Retinal pigment epithelial membrane protein